MSIGTFSRVSCFSQHTFKNCLCVRFIRFVFFLTKWSHRVGWITNKIVSYFCFTWNYLFVNNGDFFMLHFSIYTWIRIDLDIMTVTWSSAVNVHKVAFAVANPLNIQWIELFVIILRVYCRYFQGNMSTIYTSEWMCYSKLCFKLWYFRQHFILRIWKYDKFRNHISNNDTTHFFYNFS